MTLITDIVFCLKPRCPVCRKAPLFRKHTLSVVPECAECHAPLGQHDVGDGAAVLLIYFLGFLLVPSAWIFERAFSPPLWVHPVLWGTVALGLILLILPTIKAYVILLEYRHRPGDWERKA